MALIGQFCSRPETKPQIQYVRCLIRRCQYQIKVFPIYTPETLPKEAWISIFIS